MVRDDELDDDAMDAEARREWHRIYNRDWLLKRARERREAARRARQRAARTVAPVHQLIPKFAPPVPGVIAFRILYGGR